MHMRTLLLGALFASAATAANAADLPAQPLAPSAAPPSKTALQPVARRLVSPTYSETSVTRRADGTLVLNCTQKADPRAKASTQATQP